MKRLHRLEGVVEELSGQVDNGDNKPSPSSADSSGAHRDGDMDVDGKANSVRVIGMDEGRTKKDWMRRAFALGTGPPKPAFDLEKNFGRLIVDEGKSKYIDDPFWASITDEVWTYSTLVVHARHERLQGSNVDGLYRSLKSGTFLMRYTTPIPSHSPFCRVMLLPMPIIRAL